MPKPSARLSICLVAGSMLSACHLIDPTSTPVPVAIESIYQVSRMPQDKATIQFFPDRSTLHPAVTYEFPTTAYVVGDTITLRTFARRAQAPVGGVTTAITVQGLDRLRYTLIDGVGGKTLGSLDESGQFTPQQ